MKRTSNGGPDAVLADIEAARDTRDSAETRLRALVAAAMDLREASGGALTAEVIAEAAGVGRQTVIRWVAEAPTTVPDTPAPAADPVDVMDKALAVLLAAGVGPQHEVYAGLRTTDLTAKARRVLLIAKNATPHQLGGQQRDAVVAAVAVANRIMREVKS